MIKKRILSFIVAVALLQPIFPSYTTSTVKADTIEDSSSSPQVTINGEKYDVVLSNKRIENGNEVYDAYVKIPDYNCVSDIPGEEIIPEWDSTSAGFPESAATSVTYNSKKYYGDISKIIDSSDDRSQFVDVDHDQMYLAGAYAGTAYTFNARKTKNFTVNSYIYNKNLLGVSATTPVKAIIPAEDSKDSKLDLGSSIVATTPSGTTANGIQLYKLTDSTISGSTDLTKAFLFPTDGEYEETPEDMHDTGGANPTVINKPTTDTFDMICQAPFSPPSSFEGTTLPCTFPNTEAWEWRVLTRDSSVDKSHSVKIGDNYFLTASDTSLNDVHVDTTVKSITDTWCDVSTDIFLSSIGSKDDAQVIANKLPDTITRNVYAFARDGGIQYTIGSNTYESISGNPMDKSDIDKVYTNLQKKDPVLASLLKIELVGTVTFSRSDINSQVRWIDGKTKQPVVGDPDAVADTQSGYYLRMHGEYQYGACKLSNNIYGNVNVKQYNNAIHYAGTVSRPLQKCNLSVNYIDEDTNQPITGSPISSCETSRTYSETDLTSTSNSNGTNSLGAYYLPSVAPTGYNLDASKYTNLTKGYSVGFNVSSDLLPHNGWSSSTNASLNVYCKKNGYTLNVSYIDEDTNSVISTDPTINYTESDVSPMQIAGVNAVGKWYLPSSSPSGYNLDTSKYDSSTEGYHVIWNVSSSFSNHNGRSTTNAADLKIYCKKQVGAYTLNISYIDEDTNKPISNIDGCETYKVYQESDLSTVSGGKITYYLPSSVPSGYTLDTSKYFRGDTTKGYGILFDDDDPSTLPHNGYSDNNAANLQVYCKQQKGTVVKRYFLDSVEQTADKQTITDVPVGSQTYICDKSYLGYTCSTPTVTVNVKANDKVYCDFKFTTVPVETGTVIKRYYLDNVEQLADREYVYDASEGSHTYNCTKTYAGYICSNSSATVNVTANNTSYADFYFKKKSSPPTVYIEAPNNVHQGSQFIIIGDGYDPQGEGLTYYWTTSDGQSIAGTQSTLTMGSEPITVTLYVTDSEGLSSNKVTKTINPQNDPPTVTLNLPSTVTLGDDLNVNANGHDSDGDTITYAWNTPDGMTGDIKNNGGTVKFMNKDDVGKQKTFTVTVTDAYGAKGTATATTTVVEPKPTVSINQGGTLKENRKVTLSETSNGGSKSFTIDNTKTQWSFYDSDNNPINVTNTADSGIVESLDSTTGTSSMNVLFTKAGTYKVKCQVTNTNGDTAVDTKTIVVAPDELPIADFDTPQIILRDPNNHNLATINVKDKSYSTDNDTITKRVWFYSFDSNNNGSFDDESFYVYNNGSWNKYGSYADVKALAGNSKALDSINSGNLTNIQITPQNFNNETHVGTYRIEEIVQEGFGQDTIQSLVTSKDCKVGTTY